MRPHRRWVFIVVSHSLCKDCFHACQKITPQFISHEICHKTVNLNLLGINHDHFPCMPSPNFSYIASLHNGPSNFIIQEYIPVLSWFFPFEAIDELKLYCDVQVNVCQHVRVGTDTFRKLIKFQMTWQVSRHTGFFVWIFGVFYWWGLISPYHYRNPVIKIKVVHDHLILMMWIPISRTAVFIWKRSHDRAYNVTYAIPDITIQHSGTSFSCPVIIAFICGDGGHLEQLLSEYYMQLWIWESWTWIKQ